MFKNFGAYYIIHSCVKTLQSDQLYKEQLGGTNTSVPVKLDACLIESTLVVAFFDLEFSRHTFGNR